MKPEEKTPTIETIVEARYGVRFPNGYESWPEANEPFGTPFGWWKLDTPSARVQFREEWSKAIERMGVSADIGKLTFLKRDIVTTFHEAVEVID